MALENVGSFQYLMYKRYQENYIWPWKKKNLKKIKSEGPQLVIPEAQMALEIFGLFWPLILSVHYNNKECYETNNILLLIHWSYISRWWGRITKHAG